MVVVAIASKSVAGEIASRREVALRSVEGAAVTGEIARAAWPRKRRAATAAEPGIAVCYRGATAKSAATATAHVDSAPTTTAAAPAKSSAATTVVLRHGRRRNRAQRQCGRKGNHLFAHDLILPVTRVGCPDVTTFRAGEGCRLRRRTTR
jgi:hypothetical protein